jgi:hypothetical protein
MVFRFSASRSAGAAGAGLAATGAEERGSVLDVVAGPLFPALVAPLRHDGRYCIVGAIAVESSSAAAC